MLDKKHIEKLANDWMIENKGYFLVNLTVSSSNKIIVEFDSPKGVNIKDCTSLSRHIEGSLDREKEDFALEVSSPGLDEPFKVLPQYLKNIGKTVKVIGKDGKEWKGILTGADSDSFQLTVAERVKKASGKGYQNIEREVKLSYDEIKETKIVIVFK